jgi:uncharacterized Tic20 family protein
MQDFSAAPTPANPDEKKWAVILHLSPVAGYLIPLAGFVVPLVIWLLKRTDSQYLDHQGKEVLNFLISFTLYFVICLPLMLVLIGIPMIALVGLAAVALTVIAAVKTSEGKDYRYPFIFRLIR